MKQLLSTTYEFEGKKYNAIEFDLEALKGSDISETKRLFAKTGNYAPIPALDSDFCVLLLARMTKLPIEFFNDMPAKDYLAVTQQVSSFLNS